MRDRAFIIHGYLGYPEEAWLPWLKARLVERGFEVSLPLMPNADRPTVSEWDGFIRNLVGDPDEKTVMIAHSLGCVAVLRYLESLGAAGKAVGKTVLVAGGYPTGDWEDAPSEETDEVRTLRPWITGTVDPAKVKIAAGECTVILSDDDPYIPVEKARAAFQANLGARIVILHGLGHINEDSRVEELPSALEAAVS